MSVDSSVGALELPRRNAVGLWTYEPGMMPLAQLREVAAEIEELGYGSVWLPDLPGGDVFVTASQALAATSHLVVGTGIASIWMRHAAAMQGSARTLDSMFPGRFLLGVGVSHSLMVDQLVPGAYSKPLTVMAEYMDAMDKPPMGMPALPSRPPRVVGALGDKMLELSRLQADGAHPYNVTPAHTAHARDVLGTGKLLIPEQAVVLSRDRAAVLECARAYLSIYFGLANYRNNWKRQGFSDEDFADGGSERICDAVVAGGDADTIRRRVGEHLEAGADHVVVQVLASDRTPSLLEQWRELASALQFAPTG